ncbi:hypothetical protein MalM25_05520 [Planctomycetes bacterium MalM25]|nr:hypothetical protein MalM25_05520 [Planctomycetes bacterium MalM25]
MPSPSPASNTASRAFPAHPRLDRYFGSSTSEAARQRLGQCLLRGDGPALLLGAPGVGKSMLIDVLANDLAGKLHVVRLASTQLCTRRALLQAILHGLGGPYRDREEGELRLSLTDLLLDQSETGAGVALLVDEAQTLPTRLLEELRLLTNIALDGAPRLRLVLAGAHSLDESFTDPSLEAFSQRIAARCYLEPLTREEIGQYVRAHVAAAGGDADRILAADAYEALAQASDGLPRLINQVADRALTLAAERGDVAIDRQSIGDAWSDLHRLAAPWQAPASAPLAAASSPGLTAVTESALAAEDPGIEFGMLDDEEADALQAEAEAVTALTAEIAARGGVWDAGDKLHDLPTPAAPPTTEDEDEGPVAFAFPTVAEETIDADEHLDDLIKELTDDEPYEIDEEQPAAQVEPAPTPDPFNESFDEEEIVLDPYADHERVIPAAPEVVSDKPTDLEKAYQALETVESLADDSEAVLQNANDDTVTQQEVDDILVVDSEEATPAPAAHRQDYADLFANLRQG